MTLDLTSRQMDSGEADSVEPFFDVKNFNPHAKSCPKTISDAYKYHESVKTVKYQQRNLDVEHSSFVPLIFTCTGGAAPASTVSARGLQRTDDRNFAAPPLLRLVLKRKLSWKLVLEYLKHFIKFNSNFLRIKFPRKCLDNDIIPEFLRFHVPDNGSSDAQLPTETHEI